MKKWMLDLKYFTCRIDTFKTTSAHFYTSMYIFSRMTFEDSLRYCKIQLLIIDIETFTKTHTCREFTLLCVFTSIRELMFVEVHFEHLVCQRSLNK